MQDGWIFGYGSLVNEATHAHVGRAVTLRGWRRAWRHTTLRPVAYLTAVPAPEAQIDGLAVRVAAAEWTALDEREHAYAREAAGRCRPDIAELQIYAIPPGRHGRPDRAHPVLLSYLDTVVQGYLRGFGRAGAERFFATTDGWDAPIADDRPRPLYPRAQRLTTAERAFVDDHLTRLECEVVPPPVLTA